MNYILICKSCKERVEVPEDAFWKRGYIIIGERVAERHEFCDKCIAETRSKLPWSNTLSREE